ncbi:MAG: START-like domain-containing protein [Candidatus Azobacteroides sp.]|nr:START-like domain-containing protein [Candidatus Azobacteroides sp.]
MSKEKIHIEYILNTVSLTVLWTHLSTPSGLSEWFSDDVSIKGKRYIFKWKKYEQEAEQIAIRINSFIRFRWLDDENTKYYFEFRIHSDELTQDTILEIIDFSEPDEKEDVISLWNSQVETLKRSLGA